MRLAFCKSKGEATPTRDQLKRALMTGQVINYNWYAVHTRHQHEKIASRILEYKDFEVFLPLYKSRRRWKDRIKEISVPLFPGYLFVREGRERWLQILTATGVSSIVSCGDWPAIIPHAEVEGVRRLVESSLKIEPHPFLKAGDWVRVKYGPIAGVEGILLRKKNIARLILSVEMLGKSVAVEVDATNVERLPVKSSGLTFSLKDLPFLERTNGRPSTPPA